MREHASGEMGVDLEGQHDNGNGKLIMLLGTIHMVKLLLTRNKYRWRRG